MSTYTTNYNLEKPDSTDDFKDFRSNYNSNMDIIDANLGGGGGGNVDDVLVNGVSVVDGNHDAQITSYKEVTQAEYDALPSSKLTDGIAYFIKDAGGGGGGSSSHNYSTTEQVIGTWIDGKPLYERVYVNNGSDIVANSGSWTSICSETWAQNVKQIVNSLFSRQAYSGSSTGIFTPCEFMAENGAIKINPFRNLTFKSGAYFAIQYTKTTD